MKANAKIEQHKKYNELGQIERTKTIWIGGSIAEFHYQERLYMLSASDIKYQSFEIGDVFNFGSLRLRVVGIGETGTLYQFLYVMKDSWKAKARYVLSKALFLVNLDLIYYRLILTAVVWGLADHIPGQVISWHDLKWPGKKGKEGLWQVKTEFKKWLNKRKRNCKLN